jgi:hypothetical protein
LDSSRNPAPVSPLVSRLMPTPTILATHCVLDRYKRGSHGVWPASLRNLQNLANVLRAFVQLLHSQSCARSLSRAILPSLQSRVLILSESARHEAGQSAKQSEWRFNRPM